MAWSSHITYCHEVQRRTMTNRGTDQTTLPIMVRRQEDRAAIKVLNHQERCLFVWGTIPSGSAVWIASPTRVCEAYAIGLLEHRNSLVGGCWKTGETVAMDACKAVRHASMARTSQAKKKEPQTKAIAAAYQRRFSVKVKQEVVDIDNKIRLKRGCTSSNRVNE